MRLLLRRGAPAWFLRYAKGMAGERVFDAQPLPYEDEEEESFTPDQPSKLSGLRKIPKAEDLPPEDVYAIAVHGARNWIKSREFDDWDLLAEKAAALAMAGVAISKIPSLIGVDEARFRDNIDIEKISSFVNGEVAKAIYAKALSGSDKMLKLVAESRLGWSKQSTVKHEGTIKIQPVLNISLLTEDEERELRGKAPDPNTIEVIPDDGPGS